MPNELVAHLAVLSQFVSRASEAFEEKSDVIMSFVLKHVLITPPPSVSLPRRHASSSPLNYVQDVMDVDEEWVENADMWPLLRAKIIALKMCRHRCLTHAQQNKPNEIAKPVIKMYTTLLDNSGSFSPEANDDPRTKSRLRLQAAVSLLHLCTIPAFMGNILVNFVLLSITIQVSRLVVKSSV